MNRYLVALVAALGACLAASVCHATLMVEATVQPLGLGQFHYEFSITNNTVEDISTVSIVDTPPPPGDATITSTLTAPADFVADYDPNVSSHGVIFAEGMSSLFGVGTTVSGFSFDSTFGPASGFFSIFEALTVNGNTIRPQVIPEPGTLALLSLGLGVLALSPLRRRVLCKR